MAWLRGHRAAALQVRELLPDAQQPGVHGAQHAGGQEPGHGHDGHRRADLHAAGRLRLLQIPLRRAGRAHLAHHPPCRRVDAVPCPSLATPRPAAAHACTCWTCQLPCAALDIAIGLPQVPSCWSQAEEHMLALCTAGGLAATATVNIAFGLSSSYPLFLALWGLNGLLQVPAFLLCTCT